jgi:hypothetical protein
LVAVATDIGEVSFRLGDARVTRTWVAAGTVQRRVTAEDTRYRPRARSVIRGGDQRVSRQIALRMRRKSTCRRTTSSGSVTLITAGSHVTDPAVQDNSGMWTVWLFTAGVMHAATGPFRRVFPGRPGSQRPGRRVVGARDGVWPAPGTARRSALADPAQRRLGPRGGRFSRRLVLAVAPGAAGAVLVMVLPARYADHGPYCAARGGRPNPRTRKPHVLALLGRAVERFRACGDQAAFARRMRRRRSAERSSSFSPPQVPYFSGRDTA